MDRRIRASRAFEDGIVVRTYPGPKYDVLVIGRPHPYSQVEANRSVKNIQNGDRVRLCISGRLVEIVGRDGANNVNAGVLPLNTNPPEPEPYIQGLWPIGQANPTLDNLSRYSNILTIPSTGATSASLSVGPGDSRYSPLGLVTFQSESGAVSVVYHIKYADSLFTNTLTAFSTTDLSIVWEVSLGDPYASILDSESVGGERQGWLFHCPTTKYLWAVGFGSAALRKTIYVIPESGVPVTSVTSAESLQQSTLDFGHFVKGWFSPPSRPLLREETSDNIKAFKVGGVFPAIGIGEAWNILAEDLLPGYDIATSMAPLGGSDRYLAEGRWPIDGARKTVFIWVSGSKRLTNSKDSTMIQLYPGTSGSSMCGYTQQADTRTANHKAALVALDLTTGIEKWRREIEITPSVTFDYAAIAAQEAENFLSIGGSTSGVTINLWPTYGSETGFYTNLFTYQGLAAEDSITVSPSGPFNFPICGIPEGGGDPVYSTVSFYVVPWRDVDWGGGDVYTAPSACGSFTGPKYSYFAPGHIKLLPDNKNSVDVPDFLWPGDTEYIREDAVGGCASLDSAGWHWVAFSHQECFVNSFSATQGEYLGQSETFTPSVDPSACGIYTDQIRTWNAWAIGQVTHSPKTILWGTSPDGNTQVSRDLTQYFTQGTLQRGLRCNVYQIIALPNKDAVCIVRDWHGAFVDAGELEHHAYPVIEIRKRTDLSTLISRVEFFEDRTVYNAGTEEEPDIQRTYDQYISPLSLKCGKGSGHTSGPWIVWSHIVKNNVTGINYCNKVRLYFDNPGSTPSVYRNSTFVESNSLAVVDNTEKQHTLNYVGDHQIYSTGSFNSTDWIIRRTANQ